MGSLLKFLRGRIFPPYKYSKGQTNGILSKVFNGYKYSNGEHYGILVYRRKTFQSSPLFYLKKMRKEYKDTYPSNTVICMYPEWIARVHLIDSTPFFI